jgi:dTDP-4-dehydrorhamnose reductase
MKIIVLGSTGMLGWRMGKYFTDKYGEKNVHLSERGKKVPYSNNTFYFDVLKFINLLREKQFEFPECDYIINCIGLIKQYKTWNTRDALVLNSLFPLELARYCKDRDIKMIHITTDCVFSGRVGRYTEEYFHDALDEYGKTKSLGESCKSEVMVLRTSIIGEELYGNLSFIEWVKSQKGKRINGYINHIWNGVTTLQYAKLCSTIIDEGLYDNGLFHVFSNIINKYELALIINEHFKLDISVDPFETEISCDRSLSTVKKLNSKLNIPSIEEQIAEI